MHVPQRSMPKFFMSPSCPKFHPHLKITKKNLKLSLKKQKEGNPVNN
jgi:hypothetical protein